MFIPLPSVNYNYTVVRWECLSRLGGGMHAGQIPRGQERWEARAERLIKAVVIVWRGDKGRVSTAEDWLTKAEFVGLMIKLPVGTTRVKHGVWISALGAGVEGGALTITQTGKADEPWAMKE